MTSESPVANETAMENYTLRLSEAAALGPSVVGSKAANLSELLQAGFPVPDGYVLRIEAFERFCAANPAISLNNPDTLAGAVIPDDIVLELDEVLARMGGAALAVRSSASAEDLPDASYAGQYETVLNVIGPGALREAVLRCWASAFNERVASYRRRQGEAGVPPLAILIQPLIDSDAAGVVFTVNPVTGDRGETLVSAVRGLGERLVSGEATPDEWVLRDGEASATQTPESAINEEQVRQVARLARLVESHYDAPQDIEWALAGDSLYLLQARPVTTLPQIQPIPREIVVPDGFWVKDAIHYPKPMSPIGRSFYFDDIANAMTGAFREFGVLVDSLQAREIGGWSYIRIVPPGGKEGPAPPWWLLGAIVRIVPSARAVIKRARDAERERLGERLINQWRTVWRDELFQRIDAFQRVNLRELTDAELLDQLDQRIAFLQEGNNLHFRLTLPFMKAIAQYAIFCQNALGWEPRRSMELLSGLSESSTEPARRLAELAEMARERPEIVRLLTSEHSATPEQLREVDREFGQAFDDYQLRFGVRSLGEDLLEPTLGELPSLTLALLRGQLNAEYEPDAVNHQLARSRQSLIDAAQTALRSRPDDLARFNQLLQSAEQVYPVREDNSFPTYQAPIGLTRYAVLEIGRRLTERGSVASPEDALFLELDELRAAFQNGGDQTDLIARRRGEHAWALENPGPSSYGDDPGPPPDLRAVPAEARELMEALFWFMANDLDTPPPAGEGIVGVSASPGVYRGPARIIRSKDEFHKLQPGDVLVCPITSPVWSVLFSSVGALVTDTGGVLSHSAIIAREYGIPAVVATGDATSALRDGQMVTVDGGRGTVEIEQ